MHKSLKPHSPPQWHTPPNPPQITNWGPSMQMLKTCEKHPTHVYTHTCLHACVRMYVYIHKSYMSLYIWRPEGNSHSPPAYTHNHVHTCVYTYAHTIMYTCTYRFRLVMHICSSVSIDWIRVSRIQGQRRRIMESPLDKHGRGPEVTSVSRLTSLQRTTVCQLMVVTRSSEKTADPWIALLLKCVFLC